MPLLKTSLLLAAFSAQGLVAAQETQTYITVWLDQSGKPVQTIAPPLALVTPAVWYPTTSVSIWTSIPVAPGTTVDAVRGAAAATTLNTVTTKSSAATVNKNTNSNVKVAASNIAPAANSVAAVAGSPKAASSVAPVPSAPANNNKVANTANTAATSSTPNTATTGTVSGACSPDAPCTGDVTHWDGGLGACGWNVNTGSDMQIALGASVMGAQSNGKPNCGKSLTIKDPVTGQTAQATVGDKCPGCAGYSIDLTDALFAAVGSRCDGRCTGFEWWFN